MRTRCARVGADLQAIRSDFRVNSPQRRRIGGAQRRQRKSRVAQRQRLSCAAPAEIEGWRRRRLLGREDIHGRDGRSGASWDITGDLARVVVVVVCGVRAQRRIGSARRGAERRGAARRAAAARARGTRGLLGLQDRRRRRPRAPSDRSASVGRVRLPRQVVRRRAGALRTPENRCDVGDGSIHRSLVRYDLPSV